MGAGDANLLERDVELAEADALIESVAAGSGRSLVFAGPAGIGKTRLFEAACTRAADEGLQVLRARPAELEHQLGWGVVRELFEARLRALSASDRTNVMTGAACLASAVLGSGPDVGPPAEADLVAAVMHGLYWLLANLAELGGVLIAVDDAHWADDASRRWLGYLAGRLADLPVGLLVASRPSEPGAARDVVELLCADPGMRVVVPKPLSKRATTVLVRSALGPDAQSGFCQACFEVSGGNPFGLRELVGELADERVLPLDVNAGLVATVAPESLSRSAVSRVRRLGPEAGRLVDALSVLGGRARLADAAALADLDEPAAATAADSLSDAGVLEPGLPLNFVHPLMRTAVYERQPKAQRMILHRRAARLLTDRGADDGEVAVHLLAVEPAGDPSVAARLAAAGAALLARGAPGVAARYLRRAIDEPAPGEQRPALMHLLGRAETAAFGRPGLDTLEQATEVCDEPGVRAEIALEFSRAARMVAEFPRAARVLKAGLAGLDPGTALAARVEGELINVAVLAEETLAEGVRHLLRYTSPDVIGRLRDPGLLADLALSAAAQARPRDLAVGLARRSVAAMPVEGPPDPSAITSSACALLFCEEFDEAAELWERLFAYARHSGSTLVYGYASVFRAQLELRVGNIRQAEDDARTALGFHREWDSRAVEPRTYLSATLMERGALRECAELLGEAPASELPKLWDITQFLHTRGRLRLAQNRAAEALEDLLEAGRRIQAIGARNPAVIPWRSDAALAHRALGQRQEAEAVAAEEVSLARGFGAPRALAKALRAQGLVAGGEQGLACLAEAVQVCENSPARVVRAHVLFDYGAALRRLGRRAEARDALRDALELAARAGATHLADQARGELVSAGARPRRDRTTGPDALTASELRVAQMAVAGVSNRGIAQSLFLSLRTVETHLSHVYRKLAITSRGELAAILEARRPV